MTKTIRWGILGTGNIAGSFAQGLKDLPGIELGAVGSRAEKTARAFGERFDIPRHHANYEALVNDPNIDIIYISTPHPMHVDNAILCLSAGKHVLCEKPFAINAHEARRAIELARRQQLFLMEGMWTRFLPHIVRIRELVAEGAIGSPRALQANFGFRTNYDPNHRLFAPSLGGGALLDVGVYSIALAHMFFGPPSDVSGFANLAPTGVDEEAALVLRHVGGELSTLLTAIRLNTPHQATLIGVDGWIDLHPNWWSPSNFTVHRNGKEPEFFDIDTPLHGFSYEALAVSDHLRAGALESPVMPLKDTLAIAETMDQARQLWGITYPME
jgi:predicted dehydrogenase